jgi:hypothetical protein
MRSLEEMGRTLDREMEKLREFFEKEVKPTTQRELASAMHSVANRLEELARELDEQLSSQQPGAQTKKPG